MGTHSRQGERYRAGVALALLLAYFQAGADALTGKVVKVADGDTIIVLVDREQHRVRLAGIDTPERGQPYGKAAGRALAALVAGKVVRVDFDKRDRYRRIVGKVWAPGTGCGAPSCPPIDAGLSLVAAGMAWHFKRYAHEQSPEDRVAYAAAEESARAERRGLWQEPDPIPPWKWRDGQRSPAKAGAEQDTDWCSSHRFCKQMVSCPDARRGLMECGWSKLDGDGDGLPCEILCR